MRGTTNMGSDKQLVGLGTTGDSARSNIIDCIIGGQNTEIGDSQTSSCGAVGIRGGTTFLNNITNCYIFNCDIGIYAVGSVFNAVRLAGCELHSNRLGGQIRNPQGVAFDQCTFENNDEQGLIIESSRSCTLTACYFEANNVTTDATIQADLFIDYSDPGASITMNGLFFLHGNNT